MMKLFATALLFGSLVSSAQDTSRTDINLTQATVYLGYGAELVHQGKVKIGADTRTIVLTGLATTVDPNSIQISVPEQVPLLSQQFKLVEKPVKDQVRDPRMVVFEDSLVLVQKEISRIDNQIAIEQEMLTKTGYLIENTIATSANKNITGADVIKLVEVYNARIEKSKNAIFNYRLKRDDWNNLITGIRNRMNLIRPLIINRAYEGQLILQVLSNTAQEIPVSVSYYTQNAGWTAVYDIRVNSKTNKVKMVYKASITQTTGVDWKKTKLTLSTGTPVFGVAAPVLSPWLLQLYVPAVYREVNAAASMNARQMNTIQAYKEDKTLDEVVVNGYEVQKKHMTGSVATIDPTTLGQFTTMNPGQLNNNYDIDLPYDIPSDGSLRNVTVKSMEIACQLKDYAVPRMNKDAFLLAEIADWQSLDLLPGLANIIMDDTYIGKTSIDPNTTADTLNLSLGKDQRVAVSRVLVKELSGLKASGNNSKQTYTYELTVKNNKVTDVALLLKDQFPLSNIKEVEVKLEDGGTAMVNDETGVLTWKLDLKPGESRKVRFSYSIKFPKDKKIVNPK
jgi:uncharacterized protein (TIGR02231 family)